MTYDDDNNLLSETDPDGITTAYTYDSDQNTPTRQRHQLPRQNLPCNCHEKSASERSPCESSKIAPLEIKSYSISLEIPTFS